MAQRLFLSAVKIFLFSLMCLLAVRGAAQAPVDSAGRDRLLRDSVLRDSLLLAIPDSAFAGPPVITDSIKPRMALPFTSDSFRFQQGLFYRFTNPVRYTISLRQWQGKEVIFYSVVVLLLLFAVIKTGFGRYLTDLFASYFRTSVRQRQIKEQLQQAPLASLLYNAFFILSGAVFLGLLLQKYNLANQWPYWLVVAGCAAGLLVIYAGKFICLKILGWVFAQPDVTDNYIFMVFSTNKILGVLLLPFTVLLAFTAGGLQGAAATLSLILVGCLLVYRYFLSFLTVSRQVAVQPFHFLVYLLAFEVLPVLLINKLLFHYLREIA